MKKKIILLCLPVWLYALSGLVIWLFAKIRYIHTGYFAYPFGLTVERLESWGNIALISCLISLMLICVANIGYNISKIESFSMFWYYLKQIFCWHDWVYCRHYHTRRCNKCEKLEAVYFG